MADVISTLFGITPQSVNNQLDTRAVDIGKLWGAATVNPYATPAVQNAYRDQQAAQFALGSMGARAVGGMFGLQDPMLKRVTGLESILQSTQMDLGEEANNPAVFYPELQKRLAESGFTREAMQVSQVAQKAIQEATLNQVKVMSEQAQLMKAMRPNNEKRFLVAGKNVYDTETGQFIAAPDSKEQTAETISTDKLLSQAVATLNDPNATEQDKERATNVYNQLFPLKAPAGMAGYVPVNPRQGVAGGVQPIPGSKAETEAEKVKQTQLLAEQKTVSAAASRLQSAQDVSNIIDEALPLVKENTTGLVGKGLATLPGTQAFKLSGALDTLKANIGFDELQAMRDASPTGGALGQVAVQEINFLQATIAKIEQGLNDKDLKANLLKVKESYTRLQNELFKKLPKTVDNLRFDPTFQKLSGKERDAYLTKVYQKDKEFQALSEKEQIAKLNEIGQLNEKRQISIKGKVYKRPADFTDEEWNEYITFTKQQQGVKQDVGF